MNKIKITKLYGGLALEIPTPVRRLFDQVMCG